MLLNLLVGIPVMLLCLALQAYFVAICLKYFVRYKLLAQEHDSPVHSAVHLGVVMLLMLLGNFAQMAIWAALFHLLGEFDDFATALYHSGVNFATLGYGDMVMTPAWRLLGPLEAANGILMFGVSTAVMTASVSEIIKQHMARVRKHTDD
ncbi:hypothetical protein Pres01_33750 [Metapseudomonas resinovorans]|uniref:potassium channel family protein n=1 Tax=Metapseudomonas resinovorans TaxID=53412 RepID=UPI000985AFA1|nr:potassium channel family protein [Pseudomonas resinovorans]GLZ87324.1 hypothetical protein Pres01_33750 [Pseudomonas resinovorans]